MAEVDFTQNGADAQFGESQEGYEVMEGAGNAGGDANPGDKINASKNDDDERKIFVGGLSWETTTKDLKDYFSKYGDVVDCTLKTDPTTGRSRGFGFVLFSGPDCVDKVLEDSSHQLHGRTIDPKRAKARGGREPILKVFVGGLDPSIPESDIKEYFEQTFGKVKEIDLPFDKQKNQRRAFCFVTFESEQVVDAVCQDAKQTIAGKQVDIKKATPKDQQGWGYGGRGGFGGRGGRGRGRGRGRGDYSGYNQGWGNYDYNQGYSGYGYDQSYGNYGNYDYSNYYNQGYGQGWGNQGYYGNQGYGGYGYDQGYDYNGWGYGNNSQGDQQQESSYGKTKTSTSSNGSGGYHPYSR